MISKSARLAYVAILLQAFVAAQQETTANGPTVSGIVRDQFGQPVSGIVLIFEDQSGTTAAARQRRHWIQVQPDGSFSAVFPGKYQLIGISPACFAVENVVQVSETLQLALRWMGGDGSFTRPFTPGVTWSFSISLPRFSWSWSFGDSAQTSAQTVQSASSHAGVLTALDPPARAMGFSAIPQSQFASRNPSGTGWLGFDSGTPGVASWTSRSFPAANSFSTAGFATYASQSTTPITSIAPSFVLRDPLFGHSSFPSNQLSNTGFSTLTSDFRSLTNPTNWFNPSSVTSPAASWSNFNNSWKPAENSWTNYTNITNPSWNRMPSTTDDRHGKGIQVREAVECRKWNRIDR